jgi:hypothetical protein
VRASPVRLTATFLSFALLAACSGGDDGSATTAAATTPQTTAPSAASETTAAEEPPTLWVPSSLGLADWLVDDVGVEIPVRSETLRYPEIEAAVTAGVGDGTLGHSIVVVPEVIGRRLVADGILANTGYTLFAIDDPDRWVNALGVLISYPAGAEAMESATGGDTSAVTGLHRPQTGRAVLAQQVGSSTDSYAAEIHELAVEMQEALVDSLIDLNIGEARNWLLGVAGQELAEVGLPVMGKALASTGTVLGVAGFVYTMYQLQEAAGSALEARSEAASSASESALTVVGMLSDLTTDLYELRADMALGLICAEESRNRIDEITARSEQLQIAAGEAIDQMQGLGRETSNLEQWLDNHSGRIEELSGELRDELATHSCATVASVPSYVDHTELGETVSAALPIVFDDPWTPADAPTPWDDGAFAEACRLVLLAEEMYPVAHEHAGYAGDGATASVDVKVFLDEKNARNFMAVHIGVDARSCLAALGGSLIEQELVTGDFWSTLRFRNHGVYEQAGATVVIDDMLIRSDNIVVEIVTTADQARPVDVGALMAGVETVLELVHEGVPIAPVVEPIRVADPLGDFFSSIPSVDPRLRLDAMDIAFFSADLGTYDDIVAQHPQVNTEQVFSLDDDLAVPPGIVPPAPPPGGWLVATAWMAGEIPQADTDYSYVIASTFTSNTRTEDDWVPVAPYDWDTYQGTDQWYEVIWDHVAGVWRLQATETVAGGLQVRFETAARVLIDGDRVTWFIPMEEFSNPVPGIRLATFAHDGSGVDGLHGADVSGALPTEPPTLLSELVPEGALGE